MKIVINDCFGGFNLSPKGLAYYNKISGRNVTYSGDIKRNDPHLVETVEKLGDASWGAHAELRIVEIPDDVQWHISEYDGVEHVAENHRTWYYKA